MLRTAAAMAKPLSNPVKPLATTIGRGATAGTAGTGLAGAATRVAAAPAGGGTGGAGALGVAGAAGAATGAAEEPIGGDEPGAKVGSLMVGAEVGLGGKLMRTVSFFGWTLEASAGRGGNAPPGVLGIFSAISFSVNFEAKVKLRRERVKSQLRAHLIFWHATPPQI
jgi:hypothetical protein